MACDEICPICRCDSPIVRVGITVVVLRKADKTILMMTRAGSHGAGTWSVPGGHQEYGETWEETAHRELFEETGLDVQEFRQIAVTNNFMPDEKKHYVDICFMCWCPPGQKVEIKEPDKCSGYLWSDLHRAPLLTPLFLPCQNLFKAVDLEELYKLPGD